MRNLLVVLLIMVTACSSFGATAYRYGDTVATSRGDVIGGASVTVYLANTTTLATLYSGPSTSFGQTSNPISTDTHGRFNFYATSGTYDVQISGYGITTYKVEDIIIWSVGYVYDVANYGATGDGVTDDTDAIQDAIDAAVAANGIVSFPKATYRTTAKVIAGVVTIEGNGSTIYKDYDGVGLEATGGSSYTVIRDITVTASVAQAATDYDSAATAHGVVSNGSRVEFDRVRSYNHKGAGMYFDNTTGNMNKCIITNASCGGNGLAGVVITGDYPTTDDMSVWQFEGRFQGNYGHGLYAPEGCPLRSSVMWVYTEGNGLGASFPSGEYGCTFERLRFTDLWAYVEEQEDGVSELKLGPLCESNVVNSVRNSLDVDESVGVELITGITQANPGVVTTSTDHDFVAGQSAFFEGVSGMVDVNGNAYTVGTVLSTTAFEIVDTSGFTAFSSGGQVSVNGNNLWRHGNRDHQPARRHNTPSTVYNINARVGTEGEYTQIEFLGNGGRFGFLRGEGDTGGYQKLSIISQDGTNKVSIDDNGFILNNDAGIYTGGGSPEGVVAARDGSQYLNTVGGAGATLYIKESGTGNTGWTPMVSYTGALANHHQTWSLPTTNAPSPAYIGGFYDFAASSSTFGTPTTFGIANVPAAAHFMVVLGDAAVDDILIRVTGDRITDSSSVEVAYVDTLIIPNGSAVDSYFETSSKWLGEVDVVVVSGSPKLCDYGWCKYWDNGNTEFTVTGGEAVWMGDNTSTIDIMLYHHKTTGWTYTGSGPTPPTPLFSMSDVYGTNVLTNSNDYGCFKRTDGSYFIDGTASEGVIVGFTFTTAACIEYGQITLQYTQ